VYLGLSVMARAVNRSKGTRHPCHDREPFLLPMRAGRGKMARIRNIRPELFRHELLQELETKYPELRPMLVYIGLWTQAGKNGVFKWKPRQLKLDILPFIDFDMTRTLQILESAKFIIRFIVNNEEYGYIPNFAKYQAISHKEKQAPSPCPDFPGEEVVSGTVPEQSRNSPGTYPGTAQHMTYDIGHMTYDIGHIKEAQAPQAAPPLPSKNKKFIKPSLKEVQEYCQERSNGIDPQAFLDFYEAKGWRIGKEPMRDWKAAVRTWERRQMSEGKPLRIFTQTASFDIPEA